MEHLKKQMNNSENMNHTKRQNRFERLKHPEVLILQSRDREIITAVYTHRFLKRKQIQILFDWNCVTRVNARLRKLYDHLYLSRRFMSSLRGSSQAIYSLGKLGVDIVVNRLNRSIEEIEKNRKQDIAVKEIFLEHNLLANDIRIAFCKTIKKHLEARLNIWVNDRDCEEEFSVLSSAGRSLAKKFKPDGYCRFTFKDKLYSFFLEVDRGTMGHKRIEAKVKMYREYKDLGFYHRRFGVKNFRMVFVTTTMERAKNLKSVIEKLRGENFWLSTTKKVKYDVLFKKIWYKTFNNDLKPFLTDQDEAIK